MQKLNLTQALTQKLSPQQIQFIKLLQIPTAELSSRIEEELESNPVLEEGREEEQKESELEDDVNLEEESLEAIEEINLSDYVNSDEINGYKMQGDGSFDDDEREMPIPTTQSLLDNLINQLSFLKLDEKQETIGKQLVGSIDDEGYITRPLDSIVNDLAFSQNIDITPEEIEEVLKKVQLLDPPGIGARNLQECLAIQLKRKNLEDSKVKLAYKIVMLCFEEFKKKHYEKIQKKLEINQEELKAAVETILKLNPKPGGYQSVLEKSQILTPDFILKEINGRLEIILNAKNAPYLKVSQSYADMIDAYSKSKKKDKKLKQTVTFVKQKLDAAKWFIDAIKQRQETLLKTMRAIVEHQKAFFTSGDESNLKPMILKDIAHKIDMDISTVSRVANSKAVQTDFGVFPLKFFFSEGISTDEGIDVSSREVKHILKEIIQNEDKTKPLSDEKIEKLLKLKGYNIARRTVAKYREQLNIPVARLRKSL